MKDHRTKLHVSPRPFRLLGLLFWIFATVVSYLFFRSYLLIFFLCFLCIFPLLSILSGWVLARKTRGGIRIPGIEKNRPGDEVSPTVYVRNPMFYGTLDVRVELRLAMEEASPLTVSLPLLARGRRSEAGESEVRMPFSVTRIGTYRFAVDEIAVQDLFGLVRFVMPYDSKADLTVLPPVVHAKPPEAEAIAAGMTEVEESNRRGNDFSEVTDVREYAPGDRIRDIHWKLSARQEEWMVKVRTQMAGLELTVVLQLSAKEKLAEYIMTNAYQELYAWAAGENDIRLLAYTTATGGFDSYTIETPADVDRAFTELLGRSFQTFLPESGDTPEALHGILQNLYPYLSGYIRFGVLEDGTVGWIPVE